MLKDGTLKISATDYCKKKEKFRKILLRKNRMQNREEGGGTHATSLYRFSSFFLFFADQWLQRRESSLFNALQH